MKLKNNEEIRPIIGYEGLYSITSFGRVWSHVRYRKSNGGSSRKCGGKFLKGCLDSGGYLVVVLCKNGKPKTIRVHRLGATAFIPNSLNLPMVNHKDGDKQNNYAGTAAKDYEDGNLEWCTKEYNENHAMRNKLKYKFTSIYYGVSFHKNKRHKNKPWKAQIRVNKKRSYIGSFKTEIEAAIAYNNYVTKHGLNRPLNKIWGVLFGIRE